MKDEGRMKADEKTLFVSPAVYQKLVKSMLNPTSFQFLATSTPLELNRSQKVRRFFRFKKEHAMKKAHDWLFRHGDYCDSDY